MEQKMTNIISQLDEEKEKEKEKEINLIEREKEMEENENAIFIKEKENEKYQRSFNNLPLPLNMLPLSTRDIYMRDRAVLDDPLYPPLNRNSFKNHDTYRMVGYLVGEETPDDAWQLYGRKTNTGRTQFYVRPTDRTQDLKIHLQDDDMRGTPSSERLRDLDNLPENIKIDNPLLHSNKYKVIEHPYSDFHSLYI